MTSLVSITTKNISELSTSYDGLRVPLNKDQRQKIQGEYPYYGASGQVDCINDYKFDGQFLLVAEDGENLRTQKKPVAYIVNGKFWANNHVHVLKPNDEIDIQYFCHYLNSLNIMEYASDQVTRPKLKKSILDKIPVRFHSDLRIQKKLVKRINNLNTKLSAVKNILTQNQLFINEKLTDQCKTFLAKIICENMQVNSAERKYEQKTIRDLSHSIVSGFAEGNKNVQDGVIHLRMNNIGTNFKLNFNLVRRIMPTDVKLSKYALRRGDIIFNNTNSSKLVGKSAIFYHDDLCLFSNHLTRISVKKEFVTPEWILFYLRGRWLNGDFNLMCNKWINQASITREKLENMLVPVPPLPFQRKVVKYLNKISEDMHSVDEKIDAIFKVNEDTNIKFDILRRKMFADLLNEL